MVFDLDLLATPFYIIKRLQRRFVVQYGCKFKGKVLDVGCGRSPYKKYIFATEYVEMDEDPAVSPDVVGSVLKMPFPDENFDGVVCTEVLEHVKEPKKALYEIKRVLRSGGNLYLTVPMSWCLHYEPNDFYRYTKYGIRYCLESVGFEVLEIKRIGGFFSLAFQRFIDVFFFLLLRLHIPAVVSLFLLAPLSVFGYYISLPLDLLDHRDALGWVVWAREPAV